MSAQEFSSPGEHMASMSGGSSSSRSSVVYAPSNTGRGPGESSSNFNYNNINAGFNRSFDDMISSALERSERYNQKYMRYNNDLFNSAMDYDKYMSNTAIQRQVEDLKKAGLNPVLAARLGGASYKGVNAPYLSISPSSALNSFLDFGASTYQTDTQARTSIETQKMQNDSQQYIASYNKMMDKVLQNDRYGFEKELISFKRDADEFIENLKESNAEDLARLGLKNKKELSEWQHNFNIAYYNYQKYGTQDPSSSGKFMIDVLDKAATWLPFCEGFKGNTYNFNNY